MKRRRTILKLLVLLIAGAAVNVAVAWGASWFGKHPKLSETKLPLSWPVEVPSHWTAPNYTNAAVGPLWSITGYFSNRHKPEKNLVDRLMYKQTDFGWPWRSLRSEEWEELYM